MQTLEERIEDAKIFWRKQFAKLLSAGMNEEKTVFELTLQQLHNKKKEILVSFKDNEIFKLFISYEKNKETEIIKKCCGAEIKINFKKNQVIAYNSEGLELILKMAKLMFLELKNKFINEPKKIKKEMAQKLIKILEIKKNKKLKYSFSIDISKKFLDDFEISITLKINGNSILPQKIFFSCNKSNIQIMHEKIKDFIDFIQKPLIN